MKKTFPVNINGKVFYIDEDAYELLLNYLDQLRSAFGGAEGEEIVSDIESRISELFDERIAAGANAIVYSDVNNIIEIMGKPSDISDCEPEPQTDSEPSESQTATEDRQTVTESVQTDDRLHKKLYRNVNDKVLGGVLGGLATYLDWNANIMRILYVLLTCFTYFWPLTLLYLIAWMIIPPANSPRRVLEMQGQPVTVDTIGQSVLSSTTPPPYQGVPVREHSNFFTTLLSLVGKCIVGFLGLVGGAAALTATGFFLFFLIALIAFSCFDSITLINQFDPTILRINLHYAPLIALLAFMSFTLCFLIPGIALAWMAVAVLFNCKGAAKSTIIFALLLEVILIVTTIVLLIFRDGIIYGY
ncbi:MAG: PspC domain-containing protein [Muribaculaceae bacterium]|nr:PspC domain-containing protein [Muribaculaceae bacterium]